MKFGVIVFPGSNCDHDAFYAAGHNLGQKAEFIWHDSTDLGDVDAVILPGGFSYGDYLRCGAIAKFSPVMRAVKQLRGRRRPGAGHLQRVPDPGGMRAAAGRADPQPRPEIHLPRRAPAGRNGELAVHLGGAPRARFCGCRSPTARAATSPTTARSTSWKPRTASLFRYLDNPNGSLRDIAGILNRERNVMGMMPHPERATEPLMGSTDGLTIFESVLRASAVRA